MALGLPTAQVESHLRDTVGRLLRHKTEDKGNVVPQAAIDLAARLEISDERVLTEA